MNTSLWLVVTVALLVACGGPTSPGRANAKHAITAFDATPATIARGATSTLTWELSGAASVHIDQGVGMVTGRSMTVLPTRTTTYTLTASNDAGSVTAETTVNVMAETSVNPLFIDYTVDESHASSALITPEGGELVATGADGTLYTFSVPEDGLLFAATITMTPLGEVSGLPMSGGLVAGVAFQPEGLVFATPALLTIQPAQEVPIDAQIGYAFHSENRETFLYPLEGSANELRMTVRHFSGVLVGSGTPADRAEAAAHTPSEPADRISQEVAQAFDQLRRQKIGVEALTEAVMNGFRQTYEQIVKPKMDRAEAVATNGNPSDLAIIQDALGHFLSWEKQLELLGAGEFMTTERADLMAQLVRIKEMVYAAVYARCVEQHDLSVIYLLLSLERGMLLVGQGDESGRSVADCLHFELRFRSTLDVVEGSINVAVASTIPIFPIYGNEDEAELAYTTYTWQDGEGNICRFAGYYTVSSNLRAKLHWKVRFDEKTYLQSIEDISMSYDIGQPEDGFYCGPTLFKYNVFPQAYKGLHPAESGGSMLAQGWQLGETGSATIARKVYDQSGTFELCVEEACSSDVPVTELTVIELVHNPRRR